MHWILSSFLMFFSSIVMYLFVRKASLDNIQSQWTNFAMFAVPLPFYFILAVMSQESLLVTPYQFVILIITAIFFSYLGNVFSLKSIEYAPNPGYSLTISKSYVVFTTLVAVFAFGANLTPNALVSIAIIIASSSLIMISKSKESRAHVRSAWLPYSIGAFFCWGMLALSSKYLLILGVPINTRLIYIMVVVTAIIVVEMKKNNSRYPSLPRHTRITLLGIGVSSAAFNYFMQAAYQSAPNIGYVNAINAASIAAVSLFSAYYFHDELTLRKFIGIVGVTLGLILLVTLS